MSIILSIILFFAPFIIHSASVQMVLKESMVTRDSLVRQHTSHPDHTHEVVIMIQQKNLDLVHDLLMDRATPGE